MNFKSYAYLKAISDITRLRLLSLIYALPEICVCQLIDILGLSQAAVSKALGVLKRAGIVVDRRDGQWMKYKVKLPTCKFPLQAILACAADDAVIRKDLVRLKKIKKIPLEKICCDKPWRNRETKYE